MQWQAPYFSPTKKHFAALFLVSFLLRALIFLFFVQPNRYYKQPDSVDYHTYAASITYGTSMHNPATGEPMFWRTPGYPPFLAFFYYLFGFKGFNFEANRSAQEAAIWIQIFLSSLIPIIIFFLAYLLTQTYIIAWAAAGLSVVHLGLVLASTFLLSEGIALIFFYLFLLFLYKNIIPTTQPKHWIITLSLAALMLSIYTWIRPMGEIIALTSSGLLLFCAHGSWKTKIKKSALFCLLFFASIFPWYLRNYNLTNQWFFCPTSGPYFTSFCTPKILRSITGKPLKECLQQMQQVAGLEVYKKRQELQGTGIFVSPLAAKKAVMPLIWAHPWYFLYDWTKEVIKTTFDLYASQLVVIANGSFWYDPLEEFLTEKIAACLYTQPMPLFMRLIAWSEFLFSLLLWFGIFAGLWLFLFKPVFVQSSLYIKQMQWLWLTTGLMIKAAIVPSGGFGYARLRLPVEPLLIILALTFWHWVLYKKKKIGTKK